MNFDNLTLNDLMTGLYQFISSLDFALLTLTEFSILCNSLSGWIKNDSAETVSKVSQKSTVKVVTYVKRKPRSKCKANFKKNTAGQVLKYNSRSCINL